ncbi:hypothetical protein L6R46_28850 [Myxococcota bacterium]|jgi:hypothetical protein|nr:hypothetical protein [Myxococcota bacterium]
MQSAYEQYRDSGLMVIGLYTETTEYELPTSEDLQGWADTYGLTFAVTADDAAVWTRFEVDYGIPSLTLLGPGAVVVAADDMGAVSKIPEALPD